MTVRCRDLHNRVRHFTRLTFAVMLWSLLNAFWLVHDFGPEPRNLVLLALAALGSFVVGLNLLRLRRVLVGPAAPAVPGRGYLVPVVDITPDNTPNEIASQ